MRRGIATMPLDTGRVPRWLFERMRKLAREVAVILIEDYGPDEFVRRVSDPVWFQSLSCIIGMDWNSSGTTSITTGALKAGLLGLEENLGIFICGGKGKTSRKTPEEIMRWGQSRLVGIEPLTENLIYNSRMAAKVDSALVQDGFQIYHHSFFFSKNGAWSVVQQGMNQEEGTARRYHWFSENINDLVCEPHSGISSEFVGDRVLNLVAEKSAATRELSTELIQAGYKSLMKDIELLRKYSSPLSQMVAVKHRGSGEQLTLLNLEPVEFHYHPVVEEDFAKSKYLDKILARVVYENPDNYEKLVAIEGVGPKTMRALALVGEVIYGAKPSYEDPARYSFAHGGKDHTPYPIDRETYDKTIEILKKAVERSRFTLSEKRASLRRLLSQG